VDVFLFVIIVVSMTLRLRRAGGNRRADRVV